MDLSIAIVSWNTRGLLNECLKSIFETTHGIEFEVIVVDNASSDGSAEMVRGKYPLVKLIENDGNVGFPRANNQAYRSSLGRHFLLLNPDTICGDGALAGLTRFLDTNPSAGAVGPLVLNADSTLQYSWARFPSFWSEVRGMLDRQIGPAEVLPHTAEEVRAIGPFETDWVGGCGLMISRAAVDSIGLMDESFFMYNEETDWCLRLRKQGWGVWVEPSAWIIHFGGQSSSRVPEKAAKHLRVSKSKYFTKHYGWFAGVVVYAALSLRSCVGRIYSRRAA